MSDIDQEYQDYLARFQDAHGEVAVGAFAKHKGRLIKKLGADEFEPLMEEYKLAYKTYEEALIRGDTINDLVVRLIREKAATLILKDPVDL